MTTKAVHFVYLGESLPNYAKASLDLAVRFSGLEVHLLGNSELRSDVSSKNVIFTAIEDFYSPSEFGRASKSILSDKSFRNGFWLKTLERFFVIEQYMKATELQDLFHAELDQLLFRNDILLSKLGSLGHRGLFFPFHSPTKGVASVFFCNKREALRSLIDYSLMNEFESEMTLLADWAGSAPDQVFALPTLSSVLNSYHEGVIEQVIEVPHEEIGGVVDAAELGQWVGGIDPRNVPVSDIPKNKFVNTTDKGERCLSIEQLHKLEFELDKNDGVLSVNFDKQKSFVIYNLHLHSKAHKPLSQKDSSIYRFFKWANSNESRTVPGARKEQLLVHARSRIKFFVDDPRRLVYGLRRRISKLFKFRP
jgi:hypothetical protein